MYVYRRTVTIRYRRLGAGRLCAGTFRRLDFYAPRLLGARGKKFFFSKNFSRIFSKKIFFQKSFFFQEKDFFSLKQVFFQKKGIFSKKRFSSPNFFFFQMTVFFQTKTFSNTLIKSFTLIKMLMFSKLFISCCLSRRIVRIESAGKGMAI